MKKNEKYDKISTSSLTVIGIIGHWKAEAGVDSFLKAYALPNDRHDRQTVLIFIWRRKIRWVSEAHFQSISTFWVTQKGAGGWHVWWLKSKWSDILEFEKLKLLVFSLKKPLKPVNKDKLVWRNVVYFCCWNGWVSDGVFAAKNWFGRGNRHAFLAVSLFECHASCLI